MCGIFGAIGLKEKISSPDFDLMLRTLAPRGPDGCGDVRCDENCRLGHMRLAIMDTSAAGNQPLKNEAGDIWCVVNGEIYNYPQLRKELEGLGHRFSSGSDSETVLHAYEQWGEKSVERFRFW